MSNHNEDIPTKFQELARVLAVPVAGVFVGPSLLCGSICGTFCGSSVTRDLKTSSVYTLISQIHIKGLSIFTAKLICHI